MENKVKEVIEAIRKTLSHSDTYLQIIENGYVQVKCDYENGELILRHIDINCEDGSSLWLNCNTSEIHCYLPDEEGFVYEVERIVIANEEM